MGTKLSLGIKSPNSLSKVLGLPREQLEAICNNSQASYQKKNIPKKNGDTRLLDVPTYKLKTVQKAILSLLKTLTIHPAAFGATQGRCHIDNAEQHAGSQYVYCLDFSTFFPSLSFQRVYKLFLEQLDCSPTVAKLLTKATTYKYKLPTGTPTSPIIANLICYPLDLRLTGLADTFQLSYTRFVDDITFSGKSVPEDFQEKSKEIIRSIGLKIHPAKELLYSPTEMKCVTGLNVNHPKVTVPGWYKKNLRAQEHEFEKTKHLRTADENYRLWQSIQGKRQYIKTVNSRIAR